MPGLQKITLCVQRNTEVFVPYQGKSPQKKLIVIIDDSLTVRKIVETCLGREGFEVRGFQDGVEAMRWLSTPEARLPHLMILDIGLPKMDGYDIARHLKSAPQFRDTVIMMLTKRDGVVDRLKGRLVGAQAYVVKPFTTQRLISVVEAHLGIPSQSETETRPI